jgi:hypothetical protein
MEASPMMHFIEKHASGRNVLILFAAAMLVYAVMMTVTIPAVTREAHGLPVFDLRPAGYTPADAQTLLSTMSAHGKWYYAHVQIPTDFVYPALLGLFGAFAAAWLRHRIRFPRFLILVPFLTTLFDYLENIGILRMLRGPLDDRGVRFASVATVLKSVFTSVIMTGLGVLGVVVLAGFIARRVRRTNARP